MSRTVSARRFAAGLLLTVAAIGCLPCPAMAETPAETPGRDRVLILLADDFMVTEFWVPLYALQGAGYTVDVASMTTGKVKTGKNEENFAEANVTLDDVDTRNYAGLVIPGGHSPEKLEKHERALEICREFVKSGRTAAGICHGPRLLGQAGVLRGRFYTCLFMVADELPDMWTSGYFGHYVDEPVVVDRNLVTSRWPADLEPFMRQTLAVLSRGGGLAHVPSGAKVAVLHLGGSRHGVWAYTTCLKALGVAETRLVRTRQIAGLAKELTPENVDLLVVLDGRDFDRVRKDEGFAALAKAFRDAPGGPKGRIPRLAAQGDAYLLLDEMGLGGESVARLDEEVGASLKQTADLARKLVPSPEASSEAEAEAYTAVLALTPGFDDRVALAMQGYLQSAGHRVARLSFKPGWVRGLNGTPLKAEASYDRPPRLAPDALIVAPGLLWPTDANALGVRVNWLVERYNDGATLATFGFDSLHVGKDPAFAGKTFAATDQAAWFFGNTGGKYSEDLARLSADRLVSAQGIEALPQAIKLLEGMAPAETTGKGPPKK